MYFAMNRGKALLEAGMIKKCSALFLLSANVLKNVYQVCIAFACFLMIRHNRRNESKE